MLDKDFDSESQSFAETCLIWLEIGNSTRKLANKAIGCLIWPNFSKIFDCLIWSNHCTIVTSKRVYLRFTRSKGLLIRRPHPQSDWQLVLQTLFKIFPFFTPKFEQKPCYLSRVFSSLLTIVIKSTLALSLLTRCSITAQHFFLLISYFCYILYIYPYF